MNYAEENAMETDRSAPIDQHLPPMPILLKHPARIRTQPQDGHVSLQCRSTITRLAGNGWSLLANLRARAAGAVTHLCCSRMMARKNGRAPCAVCPVADRQARCRLLRRHAGPLRRICRKASTIIVHDITISIQEIR